MTPAPDMAEAPHRRAGPNPLPLHLSQAAALVQQAILSAPADPTAPPQAQIAATGAAQLQAMLDGITAWRCHPYRRAAHDVPVLWSDGATRLLDYGQAGDRVVLVIPSLINRAEILDLMPDRSFLRRVSQAGFRPLLLDWGLPGTAEQSFDLNAYADLRLRPALAIARVLAGGPVPVIGYCMGGCFAVAAAARVAGEVASLVTLGTPWDYSRSIWIAQAAQSVLGPNATEFRQGLRAMASTLGFVPHDLLQAAFASLDPGLALRKFAAFSELPQASVEAQFFVAVEDWLNAPVHLPGPAAEAVLVDWCLNNTLANGTWSLLGGPVNPTEITCPTLSICAEQDRIAPPQNAQALPARIAGAQVLRPQTGHVGLIVGSQSPTSIIAPIVRFLHAHTT